LWNLNDYFTKLSPYPPLKSPPKRGISKFNLGVYVFPGVVTVQLGIVYSNYTVQVANLNPPDLVGAVSRRRLTVHDSA